MLGEIKKVQLRKIWKNEAYDFTPWLSENLERIGEATGLELENPDNRDKVITLIKQFELENKENWNTAIN